MCRVAPIITLKSKFVVSPLSIFSAEVSENKGYFIRRLYIWKKNGQCSQDADQVPMFTIKGSPADP